MKKALVTFLLLLGVLQSVTVLAQDANKENWDFGVGVGFDFAQLLLINPRVGAGDNRIGLGGTSSAFANYKKGRAKWENGANWQFSVQRIGPKSNPFQKSADLLRLNSSFAFLLTDSSKFSYAVDAQFISQGTPSFTGNLLKDTTEARVGAISHFLAPATFQFSPGISWRPEKHLNILVSPLSTKMIIVADDRLANIPNAGGTAGVLGNPWRADGDFDRVDMQLGGTLLITYANKFWKERIGITSRLQMFSNYLRDPQRVDVDWFNALDFMLVKGLSINVALNLLYDYDIPTIIDANDDGVYNLANGDVTGHKPFITQSLAIKYNILF